MNSFAEAHFVEEAQCWFQDLVKATERELHLRTGPAIAHLAAKLSMSEDQALRIFYGKLKSVSSGRYHQLKKEYAAHVALEAARTAHARTFSERLRERGLHVIRETEAGEVGLPAYWPDEQGV